MRWRNQLDRRAFPMLANWIWHTTNEQKVGVACVTYAHLAYLYCNGLEAHLDRRAVATLLTAQIFLNIHYTYDTEPVPPPPLGLDGKDERVQQDLRSEYVENDCIELGVPQTELCSLFARAFRRLRCFLLSGFFYRFQ